MFMTPPMGCVDGLVGSVRPTMVSFFGWVDGGYGG